MMGVHITTMYAADDAASGSIGKGGGATATRACVISYSHTGNNEALAAAVARAIDADHFRVSEPKRRTMTTIVFDVLLKREPRVEFTVPEISPYDTVIFVGPVWMGQIASPLRSTIKALKSDLGSYSFVSICGGADGPNPRLAEELTRRVGSAPVALIELHLADLLPKEPAPERKDTMAYRLTSQDVERLARRTTEALPQSTSHRSTR